MSMAGTMGALSASAGLRGGHGILDGREGFWIMAGSDRCDFPKMIEGLGTEWLILGTDFKLHPSIAWSHPAFVSLTRLMAQHDVRASMIAKVRVWNVGVSRIADYAPRNAVDAQFSLPYMVATTLLGLPLTPALYADRTLRSVEVRAMLARIECLPDDSMDHDWFTKNIMRTRIEITLEDGRVLKGAAQFPGDKPKYGRDEVVAKLIAMSDGVLSASRVDQIVTTMDRIERLPDTSAVPKLLVPTRARPRRPGL
jgi:2-methylcitrate dehydratase PrpD